MVWLTALFPSKNKTYTRRGGCLRVFDAESQEVNFAISTVERVRKMP